VSVKVPRPLTWTVMVVILKSNMSGFLGASATRRCLDHPVDAEGQCPHRPYVSWPPLDPGRAAPTGSSVEEGSLRHSEMGVESWLVQMEQLLPQSRRPNHLPVTIDVNAKLEKQHMVPFSRLVRALNDEDAQRGGAHPFNNIGNLTYTSRELNSYETGLGDVMAPRADEPEANLKAHLLWDRVSGSKDADAYEKLLHLLREDAPPPDEAVVQEVFDRFCNERRKNIHGGFRAWLEDLDRATCAALALQDLSQLAQLTHGGDRVEPQRRRFVDEQHLPMGHLIRGLDLDNDVESILIRLGSRTRKGFRMKAGVLTIRLTKGRFVYLEASTHRLDLRLDGRLAPEHRALVSRVLGLDALDVPLLEAEKAQMAAIEKLPALADEVCRIEDEIRARIEERMGEKTEPGRKTRHWTSSPGNSGRFTLLEGATLLFPVPSTESATRRCATALPNHSARRYPGLEAFSGAFICFQEVMPYFFAPQKDGTSPMSIIRRQLRGMAAGACVGVRQMEYLETSTRGELVAPSGCCRRETGGARTVARSPDLDDELPRPDGLQAARCEVADRGSPRALSAQRSRMRLEKSGPTPEAWAFGVMRAWRRSSSSGFERSRKP